MIWDAERARRLFENLQRRLAILRSRAYRAVLTPDGGPDRDREIVLADLREFCRANQSTFSSDPAVAARLAGRREVWLRIMQHLSLDETVVQRFMEVEDE